MMLLHEVDKPGSNVEEYVSNLDKILSTNAEMCVQIRKQLFTFDKHLKQEEELSKKFYEQQVDQDMGQNEDEDDDWEESSRRQPNRNYENDEFMDDLYDLEVVPSGAPKDNLLIDDNDDMINDLIK